MCDLLDLGIVIQEERKVLVTDINIRVSSFLPVLFDRSLSSAKRVLVDLVLDHLLRVGHVDRTLLCRCTHLRLSSEQRGNEFGVDQRWLLVLESLSAFSGETEVRILIDGTRDQTGNVGFGAEDLRERRRERRCGLNRNKVPFADVVTRDNFKISS